MEKLIKKNSKQLIRKTKIGHLNDKNVFTKNNENIENNFLKNYVKIGKIYEKLYKKKEKFLKNNEINSENLCKNG